MLFCENSCHVPPPPHKHGSLHYHWSGKRAWIQILSVTIRTQNFLGTTASIEFCCSYFSLRLDVPNRSIGYCWITSHTAAQSLLILHNYLWLHHEWWCFGDGGCMDRIQFTQNLCTCARLSSSPRMLLESLGNKANFILAPTWFNIWIIFGEA